MQLGLVKACDKVQEGYASRLMGPFYLVALPNEPVVSATKGEDMGAYAGLARDKPLTLPGLNAFWDNVLHHASVAVKRRLKKDVINASP